MQQYKVNIAIKQWGKITFCLAYKQSVKMDCNFLIYKQ